MSENVHEVVKLLAARMESHPEEFELDGGGRWAEWFDRLIPLVTEEERVMLRGYMMQDIHEEVLDELLNGEERRAREKHEHDLERQQAQKMNTLQQQRAYLQQSQLAAQLYGQTQGSTLGSNQYANHIAPANLRLGSETLDEGMLKQIKRKLGL